ncbi:MAG: substrate-binding domain-containing protein [Alkalibacterium sp.]|nr:substrate-binding domain-containing protein [Alkalibacterium sp.]
MKARATIGVSGTGGGMEKFINGETDITNASRPVKEEEAEMLEEAGLTDRSSKLPLTACPLSFIRKTTGSIT